MKYKFGKLEKTTTWQCFYTDFKYIDPLGKAKIAEPCSTAVTLKMWYQTSNVSITWELVRQNLDSTSDLPNQKTLTMEPSNPGF